jgi:hypothetical protein
MVDLIKEELAITKKDYTIIANFLAQAQYSSEVQEGTLEMKTGFAIAVQALADALAADSVRFNANLFVTAVNTDPVPF